MKDEDATKLMLWNDQLQKENDKLWMVLILLFVIGTVYWAIALMSTPAYGQNITVVPVKPSTRASRILPPPEYDHYYEGDLTIEVKDTLEELYNACNNNNPILLGCSYRYAKNCVIYLASDKLMRKRGWNSGLLLRHEMGHCNGWPGDHPAERSVSWPSPMFVLPNERGQKP